MAPVIAVPWAKVNYLESLRVAGASARPIDPPASDDSSSPAHVLDTCDGLLLTGGADVDPALYGETERHATVKIDAARDAFEIVVARDALARDIPIFAICRGVQLLNVAAGGTLYQDLPSQHPSSVNHRKKDPLTEKIHTVEVAAGTTLARMTNAEPCTAVAVNSRHHQAVRRLAPGFLVAASAPDGVIEGIESPGRRFCVGVQWHPEDFWETGDFSFLFDAFVAAARELMLTK